MQLSLQKPRDSPPEAEGRAPLHVPGQEPIGSTGGITLHGAKPISIDMTSARILGHDKPCTAPVQRGPQAVPWEGLGGREGGVWGGRGRAPPQPRRCRALRACLVRDGRRPLDFCRIG
jgi:hypothetical protein